LEHSLDVVVAGAGPAGSSCARRAAELGLRVLLVERDRFPRPKHCAAGLSARALSRLGPEAAGVVHREFPAVEFVVGRRTTLVWTGAERVLATTTRRELDAALAGAAEEAGAAVEQGASVSGVEEAAPGSVLVTAGGRVLRARYLVAADGARGALRERCGAGAVRMSGAAYVRAFPPPGEAGALERGRVTFDLTGARRGYGWVFPKSDHLNVGVYTQRPLSGGITADLGAFLEARGLASWRHEGPFAFPVPAGPRGSRPAAGRVLFAGDAAGLADPVTGEGISHAIASGRLAAEAVAEALASRTSAGPAYAARVAAEVRPEVVLLSAIGNAFYALGPGAADRLVAAAPVRAAILRFGPWSRMGSAAGRLSVEETARGRAQ
jgi:geranylgeranyl reductase family protein